MHQDFPSPVSRFRRPALLIVGCGDVGLRVLRVLAGRWRVLALTSSPNRVPVLRAAGAVPIVGDLDRPETLARLAGLADAVLHLAPPPACGRTDPRTKNLLQALSRKERVQRLVYASTTGVYGDCGGALIDETRRLKPGTDRAHRRADAERLVREWGRRADRTASILRVPGIHAADRPGGDPRERLRRGTPVLVAEEDVYTNHIHADDLARACVRALQRAAPQRAYHVNDDTQAKVGDYYDSVADACGLERPKRITRAEAQALGLETQLSFWGESRRLLNRRMKRELGVRLREDAIVRTDGGVR